jgi:hypothetical protein
MFPGKREIIPVQKPWGTRGNTYVMFGSCLSYQVFVQYITRRPLTVGNYCIHFIPKTFIFYIFNCHGVCIVSGLYDLGVGGRLQFRGCERGWQKRA